MPLFIAIIAILVIAAGAYFFTSQSARPNDQTETVVATEETLAPTETNPIATNDTESDTPATNTTDETPLITTNVEGDVEAVIAPEAPAAVAVERSVDVSYLTPARTTHDLTVTLTVANGIVTDASVIYDNGDSFSNPHQERFDRAYRAEVIGQPIGSIRLSRVGGASLTSGAFNEAVAQIAAQL